MGKIEDRCQQSAWDRRRTPIGETSTPEDIVAAFELAGISSAPKSNEFEIPIVEDAYRINGKTHLVEEAEKGSADPEFQLIEDGYAISDPAKAWFALTVSSAVSTTERARKFIKRQGFLAYWPRRVAIRVRGRGLRRRKYPAVASLFPGVTLVHMPARGTVLQPVPCWKEHADSVRSWDASAADAMQNAINERANRAGERIVFGQPFHAPFGSLTTHEGRYHGIGDWLRNALGPVHIADGHVERIISREQAGEFNQTYKKGKKQLSKLPEWCFIGNLVMVASGPFAHFAASIEEIDEIRERLKVAVSIFGRSTPVDLELVQVKELC